MIKENFAVHMAHAGHETRSNAAEARKERNQLGKTLFDRGKNILKRRKLLQQSRTYDALAVGAEEHARETFAAFMRFDEPRFQTFLGNAAATAAVLGHETAADHIRDLIFDTPEGRMEFFESEDWGDAPIIGRVVGEAALIGARLSESSYNFPLNAPIIKDDMHLTHAGPCQHSEPSFENVTPNIRLPRELVHVLGVQHQEQVLPEEMPEHHPLESHAVHSEVLVPDIGVVVKFHYWGPSGLEQSYIPGQIDVELLNAQNTLAA